MKKMLIGSFNWTMKRWAIAIKILKTCDIKPSSISDISRKIEISRVDPGFTEVISYLIDNNALNEIESDGMSRMLLMDKNKLINILVDTEIWDVFTEFVAIKNHNWGIWKV